ncbi:MAG: carboxylesterase family protein [Eubacteriales bacterium]|nr:carboxylesterase family protein [Eubacteriales bacterium]
MRNRKRFLAVMISAMTAVSACSGITSFAAEAGAVDIVTVEGGQIQGVESDTEGVKVFKGIPFAADTSGENRWKAPQAVETWDDVKVCDTWGDQAMQKSAAELNPVGGFWGDEFYFDEAYNPKISEDGLNLNVYTPAKSTDENLPVLVYIHGGGNNHGHASEMEFNASKLAEKGIVVVCVQYRVSMYGFLTLPGLSAENENGASGNYAVQDLVKALEWVKENIAGFGGNPDQVTISGQSAGAMNVTALLRTPLAEGLFQNAIIQSGFAGLLTPEGTLPYKDMKEVQEKAEPIIKAVMGLPEETTSEELVAELRSHDAQYYMDTMSATDETQTLYDAITNISSTYVIDGYVFTEESVDLTRPGALDGINIMIGGTSDEMTSLMGDPEGTMPLDQFADTMEAMYGEEGAKAYTAEDEKEAYRLSLRANSDASFAKYVVSAEYIEKNNDSDVYVYYFNHDLPNHENPVRDEDFYGSFHSAELWYVFDSLRDVEGQRAWTDADYAMADQISSYFANFTKTGNPNGEGLTEWDVCNAETDGAFMWWHDGKSEYVENAEYPEREAANREAALAEAGLTEEDLK